MKLDKDSRFPSPLFPQPKPLRPQDPPPKPKSDESHPDINIGDDPDDDEDDTIE